MGERQPQILLYTDAAQIDARTKKFMIEAGYLPVKVATLDAVTFLEPPPPPVPQAEVGEILRAALDAIVNARGSINTIQIRCAGALCQIAVREADCGTRQGQRRRGRALTMPAPDARDG